MSIERVFLELHKPALVSATAWLIERFRAGDMLDMSQVTLVLPGSRAGRRCEELLLTQIEQQQLAYFPPLVTTVGRLPELLYESKRPVAEELLQKLAWAQALRDLDPQQLRHVIPSPPEDDEQERWLELAGLLRHQHRELAGDDLDFGHVARIGSSVQDFDEADRWKALASIQKRYLTILDELKVWDRQTARLVAIRDRECQTDGRVVLVAAVDMNRTMRLMLDQISDSVTALIFAPSYWKGRFDRHGCVEPKKWAQARIDIDSNQIRTASGPGDQADEVAQCLAELDGKYCADQITVGFPNETLVGQVQRRLDQCQIRSRWGPGKRLSDTGPFKLLEAVADYIEQGHFVDFATLVRHPDLIGWIAQQGISGDWLIELDRYYQDHLPRRLGTDWLGSFKRYQQIQRVHQQVELAVAPFRVEERRLDDWVEKLLELLVRVYGHVEFDLDDPEQHQDYLVFQSVRKGLEQFEKLPANLSPLLSAARAMRIVFQSLCTVDIPSPPADESIELLGWLELWLDDAPVTIVTSLNEGSVPKAVNSDLFLPDALRSRLGLDDNARRYARDAYALSVLLASRERLSLIVGRRDQDGDPLLPSRLLFACPPDTIAQRVKRVFSEPDSQELEAKPSSNRSSERGRFTIPRPDTTAAEVRRLSPTDFRDYLTCPYRFYLKRVLKLQSLDDDAVELDGRAFGSLVHEVLRLFGCGPIRHSTDEIEIEQFLMETLQDCVGRQFGSRPRTSVRIQAQQIALRLKAFAKRQAEWCNQGWRIAYVEAPGESTEFEFAVDDRPITVAGRIDRVDVHAETGDQCVLDYKTGDRGDGPETVHRKDKQWVELQLPLYRHLARALGFDEPLRLGYVLLPKDTNRVGFELAKWTAEELFSADETARLVVRRIRQARFWPPAEVPSERDDFAAICQSRVLDREHTH